MALELTTSEQQAIDCLNQIAAGSESAMKRFYDSFHHRVYAFALKRLNNATEATEVMHEVMMQVWRNAGQFEARSAVSSWVFGIANFKVIDKLRARGKFDSEELDDQIEDEAQVSAASLIEQAQDAGSVRECMDELSDAHRQVVHLAFFEDLSYVEIAQIANCPEGTVKTRMFHAKKLLKDCLAKLISG